MKDRIQYLENRLKFLENQLNQNSRNSHLPPSRDRAEIKQQNKKPKGGKQGGQKDHPGNTLNKFEMVDEIILHKPPNRCNCGESLDGVNLKVYDSRQVVDIPIQKFNVVDYQRMSCICPRCNTLVKGTYTKGVLAPVQYGSNIQALTVLLNNEFKVPVRKISQLYNDLFGLTMNESTIISINRKCYNLMEDSEEEIEFQLMNSGVLNTDETGAMINADIHWMHVLSTAKFTFLRIHKKRGADSFVDWLCEYKGHLVHDFFKSYLGLIKAKHNMCGSHILRELEALIENQSKWATKLKAFILQLLNQSISFNNKNKKSLRKKYLQILKKGEKEEPIPRQTGLRGQKSKSKGLNLLLRLQNFIDSVLEFAFNPLIPFTNNQAERDLRHCKIKLKVSGCFRSVGGAQSYARIISVISTLRKNSKSVFQSLVNLFNYRTVELYST